MIRRTALLLVVVTVFSCVTRAMADKDSGGTGGDANSNDLLYREHSVPDDAVTEEYVNQPFNEKEFWNTFWKKNDTSTSDDEPDSKFVPEPEAEPGSNSDKKNHQSNTDIDSVSVDQRLDASVDVDIKMGREYDKFDNKTEGAKQNQHGVRNKGEQSKGDDDTDLLNENFGDNSDGGEYVNAGEIIPDADSDAEREREKDHNEDNNKNEYKLDLLDSLFGNYNDSDYGDYYETNSMNKNQFNDESDYNEKDIMNKNQLDFGSNGVLPDYISEIFRERIRAKLTTSGSAFQVLMPEGKSSPPPVYQKIINRLRNDTYKLEFNPVFHNKSFNLIFLPPYLPLLVVGKKIPVRFFYNSTTNMNPADIKFWSSDEKETKVYGNDTFKVQNIRSRTFRPQNDSFILEGLFLGKTTVNVAVKQCRDAQETQCNTEIVSDAFNVTIMRMQRTIDKMFVNVIWAMIVLSSTGFGCTIDLKIIWSIMKRPLAPAVGFTCQFLFMPLVCLHLLRSSNHCPR